MNQIPNRTTFLLLILISFSCSKVSTDENNGNNPGGNCANNGHLIISEPRLATFQGNATSIGVDLLSLSDGSYIAALNLYNGEGWWGGSGFKGGWDIWIVKLDANFNVTWKKCFGGSKDERFMRIKALTNGTYWLACESFSNDGDIGPVGGRGNVNNNLWAFLIDGSGNILVKKVFGGSDSEGLYDIDVVPNGIVLVGYTYSKDFDVTGKHSPATNNADIWTVNLSSSSGNIVWAKCLGGAGSDFGYSVIQSSDGNIFIGGSTTSSDGDAVGNPYSSAVSAWLIKTNSSGTVSWKKYYYGGGLGEKIVGLSQTLDGGCFWTLNSDGNSNDFSGSKGGQDIWTAKVSSLGSLDWKKCIGGTGFDGVPPPGYVKPRRRSSNDEMLFYASSGSNDLDFSCRGNDPGYEYFWGKIDNTGNTHLINFKYKGNYDAESPFCIFEDASNFNLLLIRQSYATSTNYLDLVRYSK